MGRPGVTYEEVAAAARSLTEEGKRATAAAVRERLGRGSLTTIQRHLQTWREHEAPVEAVKKSMELQEILERLARELEPSKRMAEQAAILYRAFLGPETERALKKLAAEMKRSQQELERLTKLLQRLQENTSQRFAEQLRQSLERWQKSAEGLKLPELTGRIWGEQERFRQLTQELRKARSVVRAPELATAPRTESPDLQKLAQRLEALERKLELLEQGKQNRG